MWLQRKIFRILKLTAENQIIRIELRCVVNIVSLAAIFLDPSLLPSFHIATIVSPSTLPKILRMSAKSYEIAISLEVYISRACVLPALQTQYISRILP